VLSSSIYLALAVRTVEACMLRAGRVRLLPLFTTAMMVCAYLAMAALLLLIEQRSWTGLANLASQKNVWILMLAGCTFQAGVVQLLGALADSYRYEASFTISIVGDVRSVNEKRLIACLAKHLRGVHVADISLQAKASELLEDDACGVVNNLATKMMSPEKRFRDQLLARLGAGQVAVTEVTVTIVTTQVPVAKATIVRLQNHDARTLSGVLGDSLGDATTIQKLSRVSHNEQVTNTGCRSRMLTYAQFWQRMTDQTITLVIFSVLFLLSLLPILQLQTSILFNREFADIINRKVHKQEVLDDLYTPGMFYEVAPDTLQPQENAATPDRRGSVIAKLAGRRRSTIGATKPAVSIGRGKADTVQV